MRIIFGSLFLLFINLAYSQRPIDVLHYKYELELSDKTDTIIGEASIKVKFQKVSPVVEFDLVSFYDKTGMVVSEVVESGVSIPFVHKNDVLSIKPVKPGSPNEIRTFTISYMGKPGNGLVISSNLYGERTFFADNWPNRAHHWIPCNDVPSDKSSVEFQVKSPSHYKVISNGLLQEEKNISEGTKLTRWKEDIAIPTKVMVFGAARFSVTRVDSSFHIPITAWVYPQDSLKGVKDYSLAQPIISFFEELVGPYPYKKLANVQSKTIFGGMENANAIFYAEKTVTGTGESEALIAHEIAHQWFGNTVTEKNFSHLWLSEGFATYLTNLYIEHKYGEDSFQNRLEEERNEVIAFTSSKNYKPVVDSVSSFMELLNENSYQKGGWVLHMLRGEVGDVKFRQILKEYYRVYGFSNADTRDFQKIAEKVSGNNLKWFFDQWLYRPGIPELEIKTKIENDGFKLKVTQGKNLYRFPLHFILTREDGEVMKQRIMVEGKESEYKLKTNGPVKFSLDPEIQLLFVEK